jgi:amidase
MHYDSALSIGQRIQSGETSSLAVTDYLLSRIDKFDSELKSFVTVCADHAREAAIKADQEIEAGKLRSPLHGVPIAVKDLLDTSGITTTYGMKIHENKVPSKNAAVVDRLLQAGAVLLGKLKLTEGAFAQHHPSVEVPINPWNSDCWTGSSSSGSGVATAAGLCYASIGTDTGGSIRFPSASNGIVGLKPTWSRVSRAGVLPLAYTLDHIGPMTRSVRDAAAMLEIIAGRDDDDPTSSHRQVPNYLHAIDENIAGVRIGIDWSYVSDGIDPVLVSAIREAVNLLEDRGAAIVEVALPYEPVANGWLVTCAIEAAHAHSQTYWNHKDEYGPIGDLIERGLRLPASAYLDQEIVRRSFKSELKRIFEQVDLLICPSMSFSSLGRERSEQANAAIQDLSQRLRFTAPFDFSGSPTLSIPWSIGPQGVPLSVQLVGRDFEEATLINAGCALERAGGHVNHPAL